MNFLISGFAVQIESTCCYEIMPAFSSQHERTGRTHSAIEKIQTHPKFAEGKPLSKMTNSFASGSSSTWNESANAHQVLDEIIILIRNIRK